MSEYQTVALIYVGLGSLLMLVAMPLIARVVGPNRIYGYRTKTTLNDRDIWFKANVAFGRVLLITGGVVMVLSAILYAFELGVGTLIVAVNATLFGSIFTGWFLVHRIVKRLKSAKKTESND